VTSYSLVGTHHIFAQIHYLSFKTENNVADYSSLKMEATVSSETSGSFFQTTLYDIRRHKSSYWHT